MKSQGKLALIKSLSALLMAIPLAYAPAADACGGLFCSTSPVDQNAERILFEIDPLGRITATVEISFTGDPADFSWIIPVPEVPDRLDVAPVSALRLLDDATAPIVIPPPTTCDQSSNGFFGSDDRSVSASPQDADAEAGGNLTVTDLPVVGPYDPEVIEADSAEVLIDWLDENGYTITEAMHPYIEEYVGDGFKFLGVKLTPDAGVNDISPLTFSCPVGNPLVPLKLTAIASEPEMGVMVFVAGTGRFEPMNYRNINVSTDQIQFDPANRQSNYYPLVSWLIDEAGGKAFVTEYANDTESLREAVNNSPIFPNDIEEAREWNQELLSNHQYVTRLYTRISGWEMDDDPTFALTSGADVSNIYDLSNRPPVEVCGERPQPVPCGQTYCGVGSTCALDDDGLAGCACNEGTVARAITAPVGRGLGLVQTVVCQETNLNMLQSLEGTLDVCAGFSCGENGTCLPVNGFPSCECDEGNVAVNDFSRNRGLKCNAISETFAPQQLLWPEFNPPTCECIATDDVAPAFAGIALLLGLGALVRRRRV